MSPTILTFLAALHCVPHATVTVDPSLDVPGRQLHDHVWLRAPNDEVLVHELWHVCQEQWRGVARTQAEREQRERDAQFTQQLWTEEMNP